MRPSTLPERAIDSYIAFVAQATDSEKAVAEREKQPTALVRLLRQLAHFVEFACKDDMATFMATGFKPVTCSRTPPEQWPPASILSIHPGNSGPLWVVVKPLPKARLFEVRFCAGRYGGMPSGSWTIVAIPNAKKPAVLNNRTPGTTYTIQARAYGILGRLYQPDDHAKGRRILPR